MSHPQRNSQTFDSAGAGDGFLTKTHSTIGVFVTLSGDVSVGSETFEFTVEASPDDEYYAPIQYRAPSDSNVFSLTASDMTVVRDTDDGDSETVHVAFVSSNSFAVEYIRPVVSVMTPEADLSAQVDVYLSGQSQRGVQFDRSLSPL